MSNYLFNRSASVKIGPEGSEGIQLSGLRIAFEVSKSLIAEENRAKIIISNLSNDSKSFIKVDNVIVLSAGYLEDTGEEIVFAGYIKSFYDTVESPNIHTILECKDGSKKMESLKLSLSYSGSITIRQILEDLSKKVNSPIKIDFSRILMSNISTINGLSYIGELRHLLDYVCESAGLEWSFQNNSLKIQNKKETDFIQAVHLSPNTGLISSPERMQDITGSKSKNDIDVPGWKIKALLQPKIEPGNPISIESRDIKNGSIFKVHEVEHSGDTHGEEWHTTIKVEDVSTDKKVDSFDNISTRDE
jgi:hypothetical protein